MLSLLGRFARPALGRFARPGLFLSSTAGSAGGASSQSIAAAVLSHAVPHVAAHGWTDDALAKGAVDAGLSPLALGSVSPAMLVAHCNEQALAELAAGLAGRAEELAALPSPPARVAAALEARLDTLAPYAGRWHEAMAIGALPENAAETSRQVALVADEICHAAGDRSADARWYARRAGVASLVVATELSLVGDTSEGAADTRGWLRHAVGAAEGSLDTVCAAGAALEALAGGAASVVRRGAPSAASAAEPPRMPLSELASAGITALAGLAAAAVPPPAAAAAAAPQDEPVFEAGPPPEELPADEATGAEAGAAGSEAGAEPPKRKSGANVR